MIPCNMGDKEKERLPKFYATRNGQIWLSDYALNCGYMEKLDTSSTDNPGEWLTLWKEGDCYHVRRHNFATKERIFWDTFITLNGARSRFKKVANEMGFR